MPIISHKFRSHSLNPLTEILVVGTFNPDSKGNPANFFYSRPKNYMWQLLPGIYGEDNLRDAEAADKIKFSHKHRIDFIDIVENANIAEEKLTTYDDIYFR